MPISKRLIIFHFKPKKGASSEYSWVSS